MAENTEIAKEELESPVIQELQGTDPKIGKEELQGKKLEIVKEELHIPIKGTDQTKIAFVLHNVLTKEECAEYIEKTEKMGYIPAMVNVGFGKEKLMNDYRNSGRCLWDSVEEADKIWQRVKHYVPEVFSSRRVLGLNERLRFLKYTPGQFFSPHVDGAYQRDNGERSFVTIQAYLNEGFEGGSTTFLLGSHGEGKNLEVVPKTGSVLVFQHNILHEGSIVKSGTKYSCRTDVMYEAENLDDSTINENDTTPSQTQLQSQTHDKEEKSSCIIS